MANNEAESPKWVTFHDVMDDAMEGGKLLPIKRRTLLQSNFSKNHNNPDDNNLKSCEELQFKFGSLTSSVSSSSLDLTYSAYSPPDERNNSFDFSQSLGFGEEHEIQRRLVLFIHDQIAKIRFSFLK